MGFEMVIWTPGDFGMEKSHLFIPHAFIGNLWHPQALVGVNEMYKV